MGGTAHQGHGDGLGRCAEDRRREIAGEAPLPRAGQQADGVGGHAGQHPQHQQVEKIVQPVAAQHPVEKAAASLQPVHQAVQPFFSDLFPQEIPDADLHGQHTEGQQEGRHWGKQQPRQQVDGGLGHQDDRHRLKKIKPRQYGDGGELVLILRRKGVHIHTGELKCQHDGHEQDYCQKASGPQRPPFTHF